MWRNPIWSSLPDVQRFFFSCGWIYLNWCQFVVWIPEWSLWGTRVKPVKPCLIMACIWVNYLSSFLNLHFDQVLVPCPADSWFSLHPTSHANCILKLLNLGPTCGKGMSRCVGMHWNAFLAYSSNEKVVKTAPTHSLSPTVCPIGYANVMLASLFDPLKTNQLLLGCFANGWLGHRWEKSYSKSFGKRAYL